jgi:hypothetical protein
LRWDFWGFSDGLKRGNKKLQRSGGSLFLKLVFLWRDYSKHLFVAALEEAGSNRVTGGD